MKRLVPRALWTRLPVDLQFQVRLPGGAKIGYRSHPDESIGRMLFWRGPFGYEPETTRLFFLLARRARTVVDVGANTGLFSLIALAANPQCCVHAFEPVPRVHDALENNVRISGFADRCRAEMCAVGDRESVARLQVPRSAHPVESSLSPEMSCKYDGDSLDVKVVALDNYMPACAAVDLVKIDAEGYEDRVLAGMIRILERDRPDLFVECHPDGPSREVERILGDLGYRFYHLLRSGPVRRRHIEPHPRFRYRNYLCVAR